MYVRFSPYLILERSIFRTTDKDYETIDHASVEMAGIGMHGADDLSSFQGDCNQLSPKYLGSQ